MRLYFIKTKNKHGQLLVFTEKAKAVEWFKQATNFTDREIELQIGETSPMNSSGFCSIFA